MKRVLNVGGLSKAVAIPERYQGWEHILLDIDRRFGADIVMDARKLDELEAESFDAVYCSNALEHFNERDAMKVLAGFAHVLKDEGFAEVRVPDMAVVMKAVGGGLDLGETLYTIHGHNITPLDVIYGHQRDIKELGNDHYAHKTGFTPKSIASTLREAGFAMVVVAPGDWAGKEFEMMALAFKTQPTPQRVDAVLRGFP